MVRFRRFAVACFLTLLYSVVSAQTFTSTPLPALTLTNVDNPITVTSSSTDDKRAITLGSTDAAALKATTGAFVKGSYPFVANFKTAGKQTITLAVADATQSLSTTVQNYNIALAPNTTTDTSYTVVVTAAPSYSGTANISSSDGARLLQATSVTFSKGTATFVIVFKTAGAQTVTLTDAATATITSTASTVVTSSSAAAIAACGSCYATLGAGAVLQRTQFGDYNNSSNVLQSTHLGAGTPQFVVGVAYKLPIHGFLGARTGSPKKWVSLYSHLGCTKDDFFTPTEEAKAAYCYPWKAFVSLKFSPDASQTFNGFTYGISHAIHKRLDMMVGLSFSAHNEISPGFQQAALNTVKAQQAASNKYYSQWNLQTLQGNGPDAYDGFPTQLQNADGTVGSLIYGGSPLIVHYHSGFFIGVALPVSFRSAVSGGN